MNLLEQSKIVDLRKVLILLILNKWNMNNLLVILSEREKTLQYICENKKDKLFYNKSVWKSKMMTKLNTVVILKIKM